MMNYILGVALGLFSALFPLVAAAADTKGDSNDMALFMKIGGAFLVIALVGFFMSGKSGSDLGDDKLKPLVELHSKQKQFMDDMEKQFACGNTEGKGIRMIIDFMRQDCNAAKCKDILAWKARFSDEEIETDKKSFKMEIYDRQMHWLQEKGVIADANTEQMEERDKVLSKSFRAMLDYAMEQNDKGNQTEVKEIFEQLRCLNC